MLTQDTQIAFSIPSISNNGGSYISSFQVQIDNGFNSNFETISGYPNNSLQQDFIISKDIDQGLTYWVIYRVLNQIGWSEWSEITYILAAKVPSVPGSPKLGVVTSTNLQLLLSLSLDNGGSDILSYTLEYTDGTISYSSLLTYTESSTT